MGQECSHGIQRSVSRSFSLLNISSEGGAAVAGGAKAPLVSNPVTVSVTTIGGPVCDVVAGEAWSGREIKDEIERATNNQYFAESIRIFVAAEDFPDHAILSDFLQDESTIDLTVVRSQAQNINVNRYDGDYGVEVAGKELTFRIQGALVQTMFGDFAIQWFNGRECCFRIISRAGESSKWILRFLSEDPSGGFKGKYQSNRTTRNVVGYSVR
eukprot:TRINITY_DN93642_c0_g1_i1.p1 TRINITY_DN93642_c0_g1~~TRINITY_DN93642_c0_g1_i1.p1  ORF type:complete len:213 (-),score=37.98 TRINITY_DN93642_c0_g1_i1:14-652(-)